MPLDRKGLASAGEKRKTLWLVHHWLSAQYYRPQVCVSEIKFEFRKLTCWVDKIVDVLNRGEFLDRKSRPVLGGKIPLYLQRLPDVMNGADHNICG
jgi:hypothetical protein